MGHGPLDLVDAMRASERPAERSGLPSVAGCVFPRGMSLLSTCLRTKENTMGQIIASASMSLDGYIAKSDNDYWSVV